MTSWKQVTGKLLKLGSSPGAQSRWGWGPLSVWILMGQKGTWGHTGLPTAPANYSLFLCGPFEFSICDDYFRQITTFKWETCDGKLAPVMTGGILTVLWQFEANVGSTVQTKAIFQSMPCTFRTSALSLCVSLMVLTVCYLASLQVFCCFV